MPGQINRIEVIKNKYSAADYLLAPIRFVLQVSLVSYFLGSLLYRGNLQETYRNLIGKSAEKTFVDLKAKYNDLILSKVISINGLRTYEISSNKILPDENTQYRIFIPGNGGSSENFLFEAFSCAMDHNVVVRIYDHPGIGQSTGRVHNQRCLVNSALDQVSALIEQGVNPKNIILSGHSMGAATAVIATDLLHQHGMPINVFADRTFCDLATVATNTFPLLSHIWNLPLLNITLRPIVKWLIITPLLYFLNWMMDPGSAYLRIPAKNKSYTSVFQGDGEIGDKTIPPSASLDRIIEKHQLQALFKEHEPLDKQAIKNNPATDAVIFNAIENKIHTNSSLLEARYFPGIKKQTCCGLFDDAHRTSATRLGAKGETIHNFFGRSAQAFRENNQTAAQSENIDSYCSAHAR